MAEPQQIIQTQTTIDPSARPEYAQLLANLGAYTQPSGYETYGGIRTPEFNALQQRAFLAAQGLQPSWQTDIASDIAQRVAAESAGATYRPGRFQNRYSAPGAYLAGSFESGFEAPRDYQSSRYTSNYAAPDAYRAAQYRSEYDAPQDYQGRTFTSGFTKPQDYTASRYRSEYEAPDLYQATRYRSEYEAPEDYQAQRFRSTYQPQGQDFGLAAAQQYMSPYMQSVVDVQQREAQRAADIATQARGAQAVRAGAYGGSRQAITDAEAARNLATQKGDIQAQGLQAAYSQAQQQFNADQARRAQEAAQAAQYGMAAQQATEASRQFGYGQKATAEQVAAQLGLSSEQLREASRQFGYGQQANQAQMAATLGMNAEQLREASRQFGYGQGMTAEQLAAQFGLTAQQATEASRQYGYGQEAQQAQLAAQLGLSAAQLNEASRQYGYGQQMTAAQLAEQYGLSAAQLQEASRQYGYGQALNADQIAAQYAMAEQQAAEQARQYGYGQSMTSAGLSAQYGSEADRMREASRQFGASFGQENRVAALNAANALSGYGQNLYEQQTGILGLQSQLGGQQYTREQGILDTAYQDFINQRMYPLQMLGIQSDILRGLPTSSIQNVYARPPSATSQGFGLLTTGIGALGKFGGWGGGQSTNNAAGGQIKSRTAGLAELAMRKIEA